MRAGDQRAFDEFFAACSKRLAAFAMRRSGADSATVEDIVQDTLIKAVRNLASYRGEAALITWVTQICRREIADRHRTAARRPALESLDGTDGIAHLALQLRIPARQEPPAEVEAHHRSETILRALNALPERYVLALEAKYGDGLSVNEIAHLMGVTPIAAQSLLGRARDAFREQWQRTIASAPQEHDGHD